MAFAVSDLGFKKHGGILRQIHKLNKYIRYFVLYVKNSPIILENVEDSWKKWGEKPIPRSRSDYAFVNIEGKGENAGINQHFLLSPQYFLPFPKQISIFQLQLFCRPQMFPIWISLKVCHLVKELKPFPNVLTCLH